MATTAGGMTAVAGCWATSSNTTSCQCRSSSAVALTPGQWCEGHPQTSTGPPGFLGGGDGDRVGAPAAPTRRSPSSLLPGGRWRGRTELKSSLRQRRYASTLRTVIRRSITHGRAVRVLDATVGSGVRYWWDCRWSGEWFYRGFLGARCCRLVHLLCDYLVGRGNVLLLAGDIAVQVHDPVATPSAETESPPRRERIEGSWRSGPQPDLAAWFRPLCPLPVEVRG